ncbi:MAG: methylmalonyl Co-A mutase-associated GTPase MeaB [Deltaproteobacteria bacterium]|nr:methylmalonyl Co-A mutase-associated GTPase MeaB [Deltaproteobacteria bacterium]
MTEISEMTGLELFNQAETGDQVAMGRLLSLAENRAKETLDLIQKKGVISHNCCVMGITGSPGAGKSTLIGNLLSVWKTEKKKVAVLAVDPSSPFSGGAVLGDRVRMLKHSQDENILIRSLGTRGHLGGLSACIAETVELLIALGMDIVLVETAGAGQIDVEVAEVTDTTIVMLVPGWGDTMQVAKAGLLEIADIYVVNKKDLPGAETAARDIEVMLDYRQSTGWMPKVMMTKADTGEGLEELWGGVQEHQAYLSSTGERETRRRHHLAYLIRRMALAQVSSTWDRTMLVELAREVMAQETDLTRATRKALEFLREDLKAVCMGEI